MRLALFSEKNQKSKPSLGRVAVSAFYHNRHSILSDM